MDLQRLILLITVWILGGAREAFAGAAKYNAALGRPTWQSSWQYEGIDLPADKPDYGNSMKAVDGNTDGDFGRGKSCTHTAYETPPGSTIWWSVDLGVPRRVQSVKLYNREDNSNGEAYRRLKNFSIYGTEYGHAPDNATGKIECKKQTASLGNGEAKNFLCKQKVMARYIILEKEREPNIGNKGENAINILTLCEAEVYVCSDQNCADCTEDRCLTCDIGYHTQNAVCTECQDGFYGDCSQRCSGHCKDHVYCDKVSGNCPYQECEPGYRGEKCFLKCPDGTYGDGCAQTCSPNCRSSQECDHFTGHCPACADGYTGEKCEHACQLGKYGEKCDGVCSGHCENGHGNNCNNIDGSCQSCQPGYQGVKCDSECSRGRFGQDCSETCPENCKQTGVCDHIDGHCDCREGYKGNTCKDRCSVETYEFGVNCESRCSPQCGENGTCSVYDGVCDANICQPGYVGKYCSKEIDGQNSVIPVACTGAVVLAIVATGCVVFMILRRRQMEGKKPEQEENRAETLNPDVLYLTVIEGDGAGPVHDSQAYEEISEFDLQDAIPQNEEECEYILPGEGVYQGIPKAEERDLYANSDIKVYQPLLKAP